MNTWVKRMPAHQMQHEPHSFYLFFLLRTCFPILCCVIVPQTYKTHVSLGHIWHHHVPGVLALGGSLSNIGLLIIGVGCWLTRSSDAKQAGQPTPEPPWPHACLTQGQHFGICQFPLGVTCACFVFGLDVT